MKRKNVCFLITKPHLKKGPLNLQVRSLNLCRAIRVPSPMRILPVFQCAVLCLYVSLVFDANICCAKDKKRVGAVEVVGRGECADCAVSKIKTSQAFSGIKVTIDCKTKNGLFKRRGDGELDEEGKFRVNLPGKIVGDGRLKEECYAQLRSASAKQCPPHNGPKHYTKVVFKLKICNGKYTFVLVGNLKFSPVTCTSAYIWPYFKYPPKWKLPPSKNFGHSHHLFPPKVFPPKIFSPIPPKILPPPLPPKSLPPPPPPPPAVPIKKPCSPPINKSLSPPPPSVPVYKPIPNPSPVYNPPPFPIYNSKPNPPPVFKPPPFPIYNYKPKPNPPPVYKPPPFPFFKPKPKPPLFKLPLIPIYNPNPKLKPPVSIMPPPVPIYKPIPEATPVYFSPKVFPPPPPPPSPIPVYKPTPQIFYKPLPPLFPNFPPFYKLPCSPLPKLPPFPKFPPKYFQHHHHQYPNFGNYPPLPPLSPSH